MHRSVLTVFLVVLFVALVSSASTHRNGTSSEEGSQSQEEHHNPHGHGTTIVSGAIKILTYKFRKYITF